MSIARSDMLLWIPFPTTLTQSGFLMKDVKDVGYVIVSTFTVPLFLWAHRRSQNYDFPNNCEDYIHRIGRTGVCSLYS